MKLGTKIGWILVAFSIVLSIWVISGTGSRAGSTNEANEFVVTYDDGQTTGTLTKYNGSGGAVVIPDEVEGITITSIAGDVFAGNDAITSIDMKTQNNHITSIGSGAFNGCEGLSSVALSEDPGFTTIPDNAFKGCSSLSAITLGNNITTIGNNAFYGTALTTITLPSSLTSPLGEGAFDECSNLTAINASGSMFSTYDGCLYNGGGVILIRCPEGKTTLTLADSCVTINPEALKNCSFDTLNIPASVSTISDTQTNLYIGKITGTAGTAGETFAKNLQAAHVGTAYEGTPLWDDGTGGTPAPGTAYTITYDSNDTSGTTTTQSVNQGDAVTLLTDSAFTRTGYTLSSWNTLADGSGTSYAIGESITPASDMTLYAQWTASSSTAKTYTITFYSNDGTGATKTQTVTENVATALTPNTFARSGYTFDGWNTAAKGTGNPYADKATVTLTGDLSLYAQWKAGTASTTTNTNGTYTVSFDTNGGTPASYATQTIKAGAYATDPGVPTKSGCTFLGWDYGSPAGDLWNFKTYQVNFNVKLCAVWKNPDGTISKGSSGSTSGGSSGSGGHVKDSTPKTADGDLDPRYFLSLSFLLMGVAAILYSKRRKTQMITDRRNR